MSEPSPSRSSILRQPKAVWAVAFAMTVAFMGASVVDPIMPSIAAALNAGEAQVTLLFTGYFLVVSIVMLFTGWLSSRIGARKTLLIGMATIVLFAVLSGTSGGISQLVGYRMGWGVGIALFVSIALAAIVGAASGGRAQAIVLFESSFGLGMAIGPILGAVLGNANWRYPFFGTATLVAIGFVAVLTMLREEPKPKVTFKVSDTFQPLRHRALRPLIIATTVYFYGFFTILGYGPFPLHMSTYGTGAVFFGWGVAFAIFSVIVAPRIEARFGMIPVLITSLLLFTLDMVAMAFAHGPLFAALLIASGVFIGVNNAALTGSVMAGSNLPGQVVSGGYNFLRWLGAAASPWCAPHLAEALGDWAPFCAAGLSSLIAVLVILRARGHLAQGAHHGHGGTETAVPVQETHAEPQLA
ncbi:MFS transporter [Streptomyces sp. NPDC002513]